MKVKSILSETPAIPEKEGLVFHIVDMEWFNTWKRYTGYNKKEKNETPGGESETPGNGDD